MKKGVRGFLLLAGLLMAAPAVAGTVYRCDGADGARSYSSDKVSGAKCVVVSSYRNSAAKSASRSPVASVAGGKVVASASAAPKAAAASPGAPRRVTGQVYSYIEGGVRHYSSTRPHGQASALRTISYSYMETCYACSSRPGVDFSRVRLNTSAYGSEIAAASKQYGVDEAVVRAIIHAESAFNPKAVSKVGAQGLMQLMPATAQRFGVANAFDAAQNIRGGVKYLAWLLKRFDGNVSLAAAGYNAGEGAVAKYKGVPPYQETRRYVERVGLLADRYRGTLAAR
jgi:soluble lytic murein transglycosylase-like protein